MAAGGLRSHRHEHRQHASANARTLNGWGWSMPVQKPSASNILDPIERFEAQNERGFGISPETAPLVIKALRVYARMRGPDQIRSGAMELKDSHVGEIVASASLIMIGQAALRGHRAIPSLTAYLAPRGPRMMKRRRCFTLREHFFDQYSDLGRGGLGRVAAGFAVALFVTRLCEIGRFWRPPKPWPSLLIRLQLTACPAPLPRLGFKPRRASYHEALRSITIGHSKPKIPTTNVIVAKSPCGDFNVASSFCPVSARDDWRSFRINGPSDRRHGARN
jgi:hypothetical protein